MKRMILIVGIGLILCGLKGIKMRNLILCLVLMVSSIILFNCSKDENPSGPSIPNPIASFTESGEPVSPATIIFQNTSENADFYVWRFGDGETTTLTNPSHTYNTHGTYLVILIAINNNTNIADTCSKQLVIAPGSVFVEAIRIDEMPFTDSYGAGWDLLSGPEVYPDLVTSSTTVLTFRSYYYPDAAPSDLPLQWSLSTPFRITNWNTVYFVALWDYDDFGDDYIGTSYGFRIDDIITSNGYVSAITRQNSTGTISAVITLRWQ